MLLPRRESRMLAEPRAGPQGDRARRTSDHRVTGFATGFKDQAAPLAPERSRLAGASGSAPRMSVGRLVRGTVTAPSETSREPDQDPRRPLAVPRRVGTVP